MNNPYDWLNSLIDQVPAIFQPLIVALAGAIPYVEGEGAATLAIIAGINPVVAAIAGATGNIACVLGVVVLGSRIRARFVSRRSEGTETIAAQDAVVAARHRNSSPSAPSNAAAPVQTIVGGLEPLADETNAKPSKRTKGHARLSRWIDRFGVPGASIIAPLALPTMLTAAFFVGLGVSKQRVILWQVVAIVLWTGTVTVVASGVLTLLGW